MAFQAVLVAVLACFASVQSALLGSSATPQLSTVVPYNPTETTIVWNKPYCVLSNPGDTVVNVYAFMTNKNYTYQAASFPYPNCAQQPNLNDSASINSAIFRLGNDTACANNIGSSGSICNMPLVPGTTYQLKYVFASTSNPTFKMDETPWSNAVTTKTLPAASTVNTWPGKRSGGMVVVTAILSTLLFLLLAALLLVVIFKACSSDTQELVKPTEVEAPAFSHRHSSYKTHYTNKGYGEEAVTAPAKPDRYQ